MDIARRPTWPRAAFFPGLLTPDGGGATRSSCLHAAALAAHGVVATVDGLHEHGPGTVPVELPLAGCDVRSHRALRTSSSLHSPDLLRHAATILRSADVVHLNGHYDTLNYSIARMCRERGVPYIVSSRSTADPAALELLPKGLRERVLPFESEYVSGAHAIHFTTAFERDRARLAGSPRRTLVIRNAVELTEFADPPTRAQARRRLGVPSDRFVLLYLGRLVAQKQPEFALEVLSRIGPAVNALLYFVGSGTDDALHALRDTAARLDVTQRVEFVGHASGTQRADWFAASDLLLLPSAAENFSLALVEAVATGLPAIVSPRVGALELLEAGDCAAIALDPDLWATQCAEQARRQPRTARRPDQFTRLRQQFRMDEVLKEWRPVYDTLPAVEEERQTMINAPDVVAWGADRAAGTRSIRATS